MCENKSLYLYEVICQRINKEYFTEFILPSENT